MEINKIDQVIKDVVEHQKSPVKQVSDTHQAFEELYKQKIILFATLCNCFKDISWKSKKHFDSENNPMFKGEFVAGINTPYGVAISHVDSKYWDLFEVMEKIYSMSGFKEQEQELDRIAHALSKYALFTNIEIDFFEVKDDKEYITFDLAAQNTGNIFDYVHDLEDDSYSMVGSPLLYTWYDPENIEVPLGCVKKIFEVARSNHQTFQKINKKVN